MARFDFSLRKTLCSPPLPTRAYQIKKSGSSLLPWIEAHSSSRFSSALRISWRHVSPVLWPLLAKRNADSTEFGGVSRMFWPVVSLVFPPIALFFLADRTLPSQSRFFGSFVSIRIARRLLWNRRSSQITRKAVTAPTSNPANTDAPRA